MRRQFGLMLAAILLCAPALAGSQGEQQAAPARGQDDRQQQREARPQDPHRWKWWMNPDYRKELGITDAQSGQVEEIFQAMFPPQRANWREAEKLEALLTKTIKESTADVATVRQLVDRVEKMNAERRTMRAVMLYKMGLVLSPEQRVKLEEFMKRREANSGRRTSDKTEHRD